MRKRINLPQAELLDMTAAHLELPSILLINGQDRRSVRARRLAMSALMRLGASSVEAAQLLGQKSHSSALLAQQWADTASEADQSCLMQLTSMLRTRLHSAS